MGLVGVKNQHILQTMNWSRFDLEGWLIQFGAWLYTTMGTCGRALNPIAIAMDNAVKVKKQKKLSRKKELKIITDYLLSNDEQPVARRTKVVCEINDNEARAVQRLILDMQGQSEILDDWMDAIIDRYFYSQSWSEMVRENRTQADSRMDVKCGLAALHSRYGFIEF